MNPLKPILNLPSDSSYCDKSFAKFRCSVENKPAMLIRHLAMSFQPANTHSILSYLLLSQVQQEVIPQTYTTVLTAFNPTLYYNTTTPAVVA